MDTKVTIRYDRDRLMADLADSPETFDPEIDILEEIISYGRLLNAKLPSELARVINWAPQEIVSEFQPLEPGLTEVGLDIELAIPIIVRLVPNLELSKAFYWLCRKTLNRTGYLRWTISTRVSCNL